MFLYLTILLNVLFIFDNILCIFTIFYHNKLYEQYKGFIQSICIIIYNDVQTASGTIINIDITKFTSDTELHSFIWNVKYNIEFTEKEDFIKKYVENVF